MIGSRRISLAVLLLSVRAILSAQAGGLAGTKASSLLAPRANPGPDQTAVVGSPVVLDASGSTNPNNDRALSYRWELTSVPANSAAALTDATSVVSTFTPDVPGLYIAKLTVGDGNAVSTSSTIISTSHSIPVANAGPNQTAAAGSRVTLNGSGSSQVDGNRLKYSWVLTQKPGNSAAVLSGASRVMCTFLVDQPGIYVAQLVVNDGVSDSKPATVTVRTDNTSPVANPGGWQAATVGALVHLVGARSTDVDGDPLSYRWVLLSSPDGSTAALSNPTDVNPTFTPDLPGTYVAQLTVNDGTTDSEPATVVITTTKARPTAGAGPPQFVSTGTLVQLNGSGSTDLNGDLLTFRWSLIGAPPFSAASLSDSTAVNPVFTADLPGTYVAQLIVSDGLYTSAPATVMISSLDPLPPRASAGPDQAILPGTTVALAGTGTDPQGSPLNFQWALISKPPDSTASLVNATVANTGFVADVPGTYIAQLIVSNGQVSSMPATVLITTNTTAPVASAGTNQSAASGATIVLDGSSSTDANQDTLSYSWALISRPAGSTAALQSAQTVAPSFAADVPGTYLAQLVVSDSTGVSSPATVLFTAADSNVITLSPNPLITGSGGTGILTIRLSLPPGNGGQVVNLTSNDSTLAAVPATAFIPQDATGANVVVTAGGNTGITEISASGSGLSSGAASINVIAPSIALQLDASTVNVGQTVNGRVVLNAPAPSGGLALVLLSKPNDVIAVGAPSLTIPPGASTASITVTGLAVGSASIAVSAAGYSDSSVAVTVVIPAEIQLPAKTSVAPGETIVFPIALSIPAPAGGVTISLASGDTSTVAISPSTVFVAGGSTTPATQPKIAGVGFGSAPVLATAPGYKSASENVQVGIVAAFSPRNVIITGANTQNVTLYLSSPAPAAGLTVNLESSNPQAVTVPSSVTFAGGSNGVVVPLKGIAVGAATIHASAAPYTSDATASIIVISAGTVGLPTQLTVGLGVSAPLAITLPAPAPPDGTTVSLNSSDPTKLTVNPPSVVIAGGKKSPDTLPQLSGVAFGSATISAAAPGFTTAVAQVRVADTLTFFPQSVTITGIGTQNLALNLSAPAPAGGLTINLSSSNVKVATVPPTVIFQAQSTSVTVAVTSVAIGTATIHASAAPYISDTTANVTVASPGDLILPPNVTVAPGQSLAFPVTLSQPAPDGGVTVALSSSDTSKLSIAPASIQIPAGLIAPAAQPRITGVALGSASITASASGYKSVTDPVVIGLSISFSPATLSIIGTATQNLTLTLSAPAPSGTLSVNLSSTDPGVATVPPTVVFPFGATSVSVPVTGISPGSTTIHASALPNIADTTATVNVSTAAGGGFITIGTLSLGQDLEAPVTITFPQAVSAPVQLTVTSSDAKKVLVSSSPGAQGSASLTVPVAAGAVSITGIYVQGLANSGTVTLTANAPGFPGGSSIVTLTPSGFVLQGPNPTSGAFSTTQGATTNITVLAARLDSSMNFAEGQQLRAGVSSSVQLTSSSTAVGTVSPSQIAFNGGDQSVTVQFAALSTGSTTLTAAAPTGFSIPAQGANTLAVTVSPAGLVGVNATVGNGLETTARILLNGSAPSSGMQVNVVSDDPSHLLLSTGGTGPGSASIVVTIPGGTHSSGDFYVYGLSDHGTATYTASAAGFGTAKGTVTLAPSGFLVAGPVGPGALSFFTTSGAPPSTITVLSAVLDSSLNIAALQSLAGGTAITVTVTSSNSSVGRVTAPAVTIAGGSSSATTAFQPSTTGSTTLSAVPPPGFATPQNGSVVATVLTPGLGLTGGISVGAGLQEAGTLLLGQPAPPGGLQVTLTSNNPAQLLLSATATAKGSSSVTITVPGNSSSAQYFIQAVGSTGTVTYSASATGYATRTAPITLVPAGAVLFGPFGTPVYATTVGASPGIFTVSMAQLNPDGSFAGVEQLAGGTSANIVVTSSNTAVGSITSPVIIAGGSDSITTQFVPLSAGSTTVSVHAVNGFTAPTTNTSVPVTVR